MALYVYEKSVFRTNSNITKYFSVSVLRNRRTCPTDTLGTVSAAIQFNIDPRFSGRSLRYLRGHQ